MATRAAVGGQWIPSTSMSDASFAPLQSTAVAPTQCIGEPVSFASNTAFLADDGHVGTIRSFGDQAFPAEPAYALVTQAGPVGTPSSYLTKDGRLSVQDVVATRVLELTTPISAGTGVVYAPLGQRCFIFTLDGDVGTIGQNFELYSSGFTETGDVAIINLIQGSPPGSCENGPFVSLSPLVAGSTVVTVPGGVPVPQGTLGYNVMIALPAGAPSGNKYPAGTTFIMKFL